MNSEKDEVKASKPRGRWADFPLNAFLVCLLGLGLICRFYNLHWDELTLLHPDERFLTTVVWRVHLPGSWTEYFQSGISPLNPDNIPDVHYVYGQFPILLGKLVATAFSSQVTQDYQFLPYGRALSALFDCFTVLLTYGIAKRLLGKTGGLLAASLVSLAALHIQQSHFFVVDTFAATFITFALQGALKWMETGKVKDAVEMGLGLGLALACKLSGLLFLIAVVAAAIVVNRRFGMKKALVGLAAFGFATLILFRLANPMAFLGEGGLWSIFDIRPDRRFLDDLHTQAAITSGEGLVPFNVQWISRQPWLFSFSNLASWGWGTAFMLSGLLGMLFIWLNVLDKKRPAAAIWLVLIYALAVFLIQGATFSKFTRYYLPITGSAAIIAAYGWCEIVRRWPKWRWGQAAVALGAALWAVAVTSVYSSRHTRLLATDWIRLNIPAGTIMARETVWDDGLPLAWVPWPEDHPGYDDFHYLDLLAFETDTAEKRRRVIDNLDASEWILISSPRSWATVPRWPERYPMMTRFYQTLFDGKLGFTLEKEFTSYPRLGPWTFPDGGAEEALTVYDHPRVLLFRKSRWWSRERTRDLLEGPVLPTRESGWEPRRAPRINEADLPQPPG